MSVLNITWSERITNFEVRRRTGQPLLSGSALTRRLKLFGHVAWADKSQDCSRALQACISPTPRNWRRRPGRPRHTWLRTVEEDLRQFNLGLASELRRAQNRTTWRTLTGIATSPTSSDWWLSITPTFPLETQKLRIFSWNPSHHRPTPSIWLSSRTLDFSIVFFLVFSINLLVWFAQYRLNWLPVGFRLHVKHLHSHFHYHTALCNFLSPINRNYIVNSTTNWAC